MYIKKLIKKAAEVIIKTFLLFAIAIGLLIIACMALAMIITFIF